MARSVPSICFDSIDSHLGVEDMYISNWMNCLSKNFNVFFYNQQIAGSFALKTNSFSKKRLFSDIKVHKNLLASFCFNRGILCNDSILQSLKSKGVSNFGVVYGHEISQEMSRAIQLGLFDQILISNFSSLRDNILSLNPMQPIFSIKDSFACSLGRMRKGIGILVPKNYINDTVLNSQVSFLRNKFKEVGFVCVGDYSCDIFEDGCLLLPQHGFQEEFLKKANSILCAGINVFVPKETEKAFSFGIPYCDVSEIKNVTINTYLDKENCFDVYKFNSSIMSIINRS